MSHFRRDHDAMRSGLDGPVPRATRCLQGGNPRPQPPSPYPPPRAPTTFTCPMPHAPCPRPRAALCGGAAPSRRADQRGWGHWPTTRRCTAAGTAPGGGTRTGARARLPRRTRGGRRERTVSGRGLGAFGGEEEEGVRRAGDCARSGHRVAAAILPPLPLGAGLLLTPQHRGGRDDTPPPQVIGPNFLPGLRPNKNFLCRLQRQFTLTKHFIQRLYKLHTTGTPPPPILVVPHRGQGLLSLVPGPVWTGFVVTAPRFALLGHPPSPMGTAMSNPKASTILQNTSEAQITPKQDRTHRHFTIHMYFALTVRAPPLKPQHRCGGGDWAPPAHHRLGSANAETTPAGAPAAAADRTQRPDATCEGKTGGLSRAP